MKIAILGPDGQLGTELMRCFGNEAKPFPISEVDITKKETLEKIADFSPDIVINASGYVNVSGAEDDFENCFNVNALGALNVAKICKKINAVNVFISTDYVFDGLKRIPYNEDDQPDPINVYGCSKYTGEIFTRKYSGDYYIIRTSSLFGRGAAGKKRNFIDSMLSGSRKGNELEVVDDVIMSPTYATDLANAIKILLSTKPAIGIYHISNKGQCTWFDFAFELLRLAGMKAHLKRVKTMKYDKNLKRPIFSALSCKKADSLGIVMRPWQSALADCLKRYYTK